MHHLPVHTVHTGRKEDAALSYRTDLKQLRRDKNWKESLRNWVPQLIVETYLIRYPETSSFDVRRPVLLQFTDRQHEARKRRIKPYPSVPALVWPVTKVVAGTVTIVERSRRSGTEYQVQMLVFT